MSGMQRQIEEFISSLNRELAAHARATGPDEKNSLIPVIRFPSSKITSRR
jgi:hypothetical protein